MTDAIIKVLSDFNPDQAITYEGAPGRDEIVVSGVGRCLLDPSSAGEVVHD